jgi:hypothetical protein
MGGQHCATAPKTISVYDLRLATLAKTCRKLVHKEKTSARMKIRHVKSGSKNINMNSTF